jgi:2,5-furandicarboxylate decarboxylase 1
MEASRDLILIPEARGHEYVRAGNNGIRAKLGIDATVPLAERDRFKRMHFEATAATLDDLGGDVAAIERIVRG